MRNQIVRLKALVGEPMNGPSRRMSEDYSRITHLGGQAVGIDASLGLKRAKKCPLRGDERAELFRRTVRLGGRWEDRSFSVEGRGGSLKDMFSHHPARFERAGSLIPDHGDIPVRFPHSLGR